MAAILKTAPLLPRPTPPALGTPGPGAPSRLSTRSAGPRGIPALRRLPLALACAVALLAGCAGPRPPAVPSDTAPAASLPEPGGPLPPPASIEPPSPPSPEALAELEDALQWAAAQPLPAPQQRPKSRWLPVPWTELPGLRLDPVSGDWHAAWDAWIRSCARPAPAWAAACRAVRPLALQEPVRQLAWMVRHLQPYRIADPQGSLPAGLLTGYYEPEMAASRVRTASHGVPLYAPPAGLAQRQPWYSRQDIDSRPEVQALLAGRELVWLQDPIDALIVQIQGSARLRVAEPDGSQRLVRLGFAGHNGHPYRSVGRWLLDRKAIAEPSWAAIKAWARDNPEQLHAMLWSNPRTVFFREEPLAPEDAELGPRGAQGVPLTPERSVAIDPEAVPYGTPVWLASPGPVRALQRLALAQDTGAAITGAARADLFTGWGDAALDRAQGLRQPLQMWALWPR